MSIPDPSPVVDLIEAFRRSKTMFTAVSLGVFDRLHQSPAQAGELAAALGASVNGVEQLLDACAALGFVDKKEQVYANTAVAEHYLRTGSPHSLCGYIRYSDQALYPMWAHLADAVREGTPRWQQTFGLNGPIFSSFFRTEEAMRDFLRGMHGFGMLTSPTVVSAFDLSGFRKLVDLGGATGHLAIAACERYPDLRAAVFELPAAIAAAREQIAFSPARGRLEVLAGDFFVDALPPADLYSLGQILHDWTDARCDALLSAIYKRLPPGGALLVVEKLLAEDGVGPVAANLQSLNMLVVTEGRERTLSQYAALLRRAGFASVEGRRTGVRLDGILAVKERPSPAR
jgi:acetylserotonin N-methyltransferase